MNDDAYKAFLAGLKVGDKVGIYHSYYSTVTYSIDKIKKITPTRMIDTENIPSRFKNGEIYNGNIYSSTYTKLVPITQEVLDHIEREKLVSWFSKLDKSKLDLDQLREIKKIVDGGK